MASKGARITTLVGAILTTVFSSILIIATFGIGVIFSVPVIVFAWVGRHMAINKMNKGWTIAMIVLTAIWGFFWTWGGIVELVGYIIHLVNLNKQPLLINEPQEFTQF